MNIEPSEIQKSQDHYFVPLKDSEKEKNQEVQQGQPGQKFMVQLGGGDNCEKGDDNDNQSSGRSSFSQETEKCSPKNKIQGSQQIKNVLDQIPQEFKMKKKMSNSNGKGNQFSIRRDTLIKHYDEIPKNVSDTNNKKMHLRKQKSLQNPNRFQIRRDSLVQDFQKPPTNNKDILKKKNSTVNITASTNNINKFHIRRDTLLGLTPLPRQKSFSHGAISKSRSLHN